MIALIAVLRSFTLVQALSLAIIALTLMSCGQSSGGAITIDTRLTFQTMDGFGTSIGDSDPTLITDDLADLLWDPDKGIGLSIFRMQIDSDGQPSRDLGDFARAGGWDLWGHVHKALRRNPSLRVIGSPMSPPAEWKDNHSLNNGGALCAAGGQGLCAEGHYRDWAATVVSFVTTAAAQKPPVPIYAIGIQNEPDIAVPYESCMYSPEQASEFVKSLGRELSRLHPRPKLMAPEVSDWAKLAPYIRAMEADDAATRSVDFYAVHQYGRPESIRPVSSRRSLWQTEMSGVAGGPEARWDPSIDNAIAVAGWIHTAVVTGNVTAWMWWRALNEGGKGSPPTVDDNQDLIVGRDNRLPADTNITKRLYALGNFSKFVRPGYVRVGVSGRIPAGVSLSAYLAPTGRLVAVAINRNRAAISLSLSVAGRRSPDRFSPWVTSNRFNLEQQASVRVIDGRATYALPARSITTLVSE